MKALVVNTKKGSFENKETGEVVEFSTTTLGHIAEDSDNFSGYILEEITGKASDFEIIKSYTNKIVEIDMEYKKIDRKNYRAKLKKIADVQL